MTGYTRNEIVTGDARLLAASIPDALCAMAFADPPYWVDFDYGHAKDSELSYIDPVWLVAELRRIARIVFVTPGIANLWDYPRPDWVLGWFKFGATGRSAHGGFNVWEPVLAYGDLPRTLWQDGVNIPTYRNHYNINGSYKVLPFACPKPEPLLAWLMQSVTQPGDTVFDPMIGTGTTAVVAKKLGRSFIGFEIDPATAERARERLAHTQPPLPGLVVEQMSMEAA